MKTQAKGVTASTDLANGIALLGCGLVIPCRPVRVQESACDLPVHPLEVGVVHEHVVVEWWEHVVVVVVCHVSLLLILLKYRQKSRLDFDLFGVRVVYHLYHL